MKIGKIYVDFGLGSSQSVTQFRAYCFECEIETIVRYNKEGHPYCNQCGLKH